VARDRQRIVNRPTPGVSHQLAALCAGIFVAACTNVTQSTGGAGPGNAWTIPGVVRVTVNTDINTFDPVISKLYIENYVEEAIFSGLVKYDASGKLVGDLASEVPSPANGGVSKDGRTITYHLRFGALWQDGVMVTSADVKFTYDLIMNPAVNSPVRSTYARIARLDTPDPLTVVLHLHEPFAPVLSQVFCNGAFGQIVPRHVLAGSRDINRDPFNVHPIGSGPYVMKRWDRGSVIVLSANARYFGGAPHVREIDVEIVPNQNTQLISTEGHQLDVATQARPSQITAYRRIPGIRVLLAPTYVLDTLDFNVTHPPFDDVRVRRALAMALDRRTIVSNASSGTSILAQTFIPPYNWAYDPNNGAIPYDLPAAKRLLDDAGWTVGADGVRVKQGRRLSFGLVHNQATTSSTIAQEVERAWRAIGAEVLIRAAPRNVLIGTIEPNGTFDVAIGGAGYDADPDRSQYQETSFIEPHGFNDTRYSDADLDRWTESALQTYDRTARKHLYSLIQRRLNRDVPWVPLAWEQFVFAVNTDLRGFEPETVNSDFWNVQNWTI
jgi:peptide/nickel transport system substrate-binding protein